MSQNKENGHKALLSWCDISIRLLGKIMSKYVGMYVCRYVCMYVCINWSINKMWQKSIAKQWPWIPFWLLF